MRAFKFRAWDGAVLHYGVVPFAWDFVISRTWHKCIRSTGGGILGSGGKEADFEVPGIRYQILEQFTGLLDKNGKEIYEGDIVLFDMDGDVSTHSVRYMADQNYPAFDLYPQLEVDINGLSQAMSDSCHTVEVIGNIHQNPELLGKEAPHA